MKTLIATARTKQQTSAKCIAASPPPMPMGITRHSTTASMSTTTAARSRGDAIGLVIAESLQRRLRRRPFAGLRLRPLDFGARSKVYSVAMALTVAKLAGRAGLSPDAVRYYERAGLLPAPERSDAGYRLYDERLLDRLNFIKGAQRTGLRLREIRELLEIIDRGACPCGHTESILSERITDIDREIKQLRDVRKHLVALKDHLPSSAGWAEESAPWSCERAFIEVGAKQGG